MFYLVWQNVSLDWQYFTLCYEMTPTPGTLLGLVSGGFILIEMYYDFGRIRSAVK